MTTYYVHNKKGNDSNSGEQQTQAWKSLARVNAATLKPGDTLLFRSGQIWEGTLNAKWNGTPTSPIVISNYGLGTKPVIRNGPLDAQDSFHINGKITGSYLYILGIDTTIVNPPVHPSCNQNPLGWFVGWNFMEGAHDNVLSDSRVSRHTAGVHMQTSTHHNRILKCSFIENNAMEQLTAGGDADDIGAWGILMKGNDHEVGHCLFNNNNALCGFDTLPQGNSVELYEAKRCRIHHNIAQGDRVFSELGSSAKVISMDNVFAYNLIISHIIDAKGWTTRGPGADFGPVYNTQLFNNTVFLTGPLSQAFNCGYCSPAMLTAIGNIFVAGWKAGYADAPFIERRNIYWKVGGNPYVQFKGFSIHSTSMKIDPQLVAPMAGDCHLKPGSPAINKGEDTGWYEDLDGVPVQEGVHDIGAYEYIAA